MLSVENISKSFGPQVLFSGATFSVPDDARIGVVGPNGSGKSTFLRILTGDDHADEGEIRFPKGYRVACMQQEWVPNPKHTVLEAALCEHRPWREARDRLKSLSGKLESDHSHEAVGRYHRAEAEFTALGGWDLEPQARSILAGLGFRPEEIETPAAHLSGGWRLRCHMAGLLLSRADLLLLDEPTNHLDIETVVWLENFLSSYPHAVMLISHDRRLISRFATSILEFSPPRLTFWRETLERFEKQRALRIAQIEAEIATKLKEIERLQQFVDRFRAKATKARQAQNRLKTAEYTMEQVAELKAGMPVIVKRPARFRLPLRSRLPRAVIEIDSATFGYDEKAPLFGLERCVVESGRKIGVIGVNGVGKSTFLKCCAGLIPLLRGAIKRADNVEIGYFAQHSIEQLPSGIEVFDYLFRSCPGNTISEVRGVAASLGLLSGDMDKPIEVLSGGEKARVTLSHILLRRPGLLLLDEPTNHLDLEAADALVRGLSQYEGSVLAVSHNRDFLDALVSLVLEIRSGRGDMFHGNYSDWLDLKGGLSPRRFKDPDVLSTPARERKERKRQEAEERKRKSGLTHKLRSNLAQVEAELEKLRSECKELDALLCDPATPTKPEFGAWLKRRSELAAAIEDLETAWLELASKLDEE